MTGSRSVQDVAQVRVRAFAGKRPHSGFCVRLPGSFLITMPAGRAGPSALAQVPLAACAAKRPLARRVGRSF